MQKCVQNVHVCNAFGLFNLPCKGDNHIDISSTGDYLLCSDKSCFCIIDIQSQLYNDRCLRRRGEEYTPCSCTNKNNSRTSPAPCDTLLTKSFTYKNKCAATLWYPVEDRIFISAGDSMVNVWDLNVPEISYSFNVKLSNVKKLAVQFGASDSPIIAAGLTCGSISACDMRAGSAFNYVKTSLTGEVTALSFQRHNDNLIVAGYEDATVAIWDLRRYNRPLTVLSSENDTTTTTTTIINGCNVAYVDNDHLSDVRELPVSHCQDFKKEDDVWSYVIGHNNNCIPASRDVSAFHSFEDKASSTRGGNAPIKAKRPASTISITDLLSAGGKKRTPAGPSPQRSGSRSSKPSTTLGRLMGIHRIQDSRRRLYSGPPAHVQPTTPSHIASPRKRPDRPLLSAVTQKNVKAKGIPSSVECTRDGHTLFVARHKGFIEEYDARNYHYIRDFAVDSLIGSHLLDDAGEYSQSMRLLSCLDGDNILFNLRQQLAVLDVRRNTLCGLFPLEWENHNALVDRQHAHSRGDIGLQKKYVTDLTALPNRREIYVINEMGELFVVHPDKRRVLRQRTQDEGHLSDDMEGD